MPTTALLPTSSLIASSFAEPRIGESTVEVQEDRDRAVLFNLVVKLVFNMNDGARYIMVTSWLLYIQS